MTTPETPPPPNAVPFPAMTSSSPGSSSGDLPPPPSPPPLPPRETFERDRRPMGPWLSGFLGGLIGGVAIATLAIVAVVAGWSGLRARLDSGMEQRVAAVQGRLEALDRQLQTRLAERSAGVGEPAAPAPAAATPTAPPQSAAVGPSAAELAQLSDLGHRIDALSGQFDQLKTTMPNQATIATLATRTEEALAAARDLANRRQSTQALLLVAGQLRDAVERGDPYQPELDAARKLAGDSDKPALDALAATAARGVARRATLLADYAAAADAATVAAVAPAGNSDMVDRIKAQVASLFSLRRTDAAGKDTSAVLSRAQARIDQGDLAGAVAEVDGLSGPAATSMSAWKDKATARVAADKALSQIEADLAAKSASAN